MKLRSILILISLIILSISGCGEAPPSSSPPQATDFGKDISIFLDTSMSMKGYFRHQKQKGTLFQRFMWTGFGSSLKVALPEEKTYIIPFGTKIGKSELLSPSQSFLEKFRYSSQKKIDSIYSETDTKLVELFNNDRLTANRLFIILTDGVPSSPDGSGPDPRILSVIKQNILDKEHHLWLIGVRTEYNGFVYPETPDDFGNKAKFRYKGLRPVYIWIGSKNISEGNAVVSNFSKGLEKLISEESNKGLSFKLIEFPFIQIPQAKLQLAQHDFDGDYLSQIRSHPVEDYFEISVARSFSGDLDIPIVIDWNKETINYELNLSFNYNDIWYANENHTWVFHLNSRRIPKRLNIVMTAEPKIDRWWEKWSTDDDSVRENAGQTLYLTDLVDGLFVPGKKEVGELKLKFR